MSRRPPNTTEDGQLACAYGEPWSGPHPLCDAAVEESCRQFHKDVAAGKFDADGYTPAERRAQQARKEQQPMAKRAKDTKPKPHGRQPRQPPLGGMEKARIAALDDVAASIAETREQINELRGQESEILRTALKAMRKHNKTTWRAAGVELARVPGEEKLRVRTTKQAATAETEEEDEHVEVEEVETADGEVVDGPGEEIRPGAGSER